MIEPRLIKGIAFGAACLLGMRDCLIKRLPTDRPDPFLEELANHVRDLFLQYGYSADFEHAYSLNRAYFAQHPNKVKHFLNGVYCVYVANREHMHLIWDHFRGREITYANFAALQGHSAVRGFLNACVACLDLFDQLLGQQDTLTTAIGIYLRTHAIGPEEFHSFLKQPIIMRLQSSSLDQTPLLPGASRVTYRAS